MPSTTKLIRILINCKDVNVGKHSFFSVSLRVLHFSLCWFEKEKKKKSFEGKQIRLPKKWEETSPSSAIISRNFCAMPSAQHTQRFAWAKKSARVAFMIYFSLHFVYVWRWFDPFDDHDNEKQRAKVSGEEWKKRPIWDGARRKRLQRRCPWIN